MPPVNIAPAVTMRIILVKQVVPATVMDKSVGIVDPILFGAIMPFRPHMYLQKNAPEVFQARYVYGISERVAVPPLLTGAVTRLVALP